MPQDKINNLNEPTLRSGFTKCILNAQQLCLEAKLLHENEMYARSYSLSHFAREELAKSLMLYRALGEKAAGRQVNWKRLNRRFRDHKQKIINDRLISVMLLADDDSDEKISDHLKGIEFTNNRKNQCLYVDWEQNDFVMPEEKITKELSDRNLKLATYRIAAFSKIFEKLLEAINHSTEIIENSPDLQAFYNSPNDSKTMLVETFLDTNISRLSALSKAINKELFD